MRLDICETNSKIAFKMQMKVQVKRYAANTPFYIYSELPFVVYL